MSRKTRNMKNITKEQVRELIPYVVTSLIEFGSYRKMPISANGTSYATKSHYTLIKDFGLLEELKSAWKKEVIGK